ncbi:MAG: ATP-grasp domain-containing protein [Chloroflexota bacterium]
MADKQMRVLVVDAGVRHAIDIIRSLGQQGIEVSAVFKSQNLPASHSRYLKESYVFPLDANVEDVEPSLAYLEELLKSEHFDVTIAAGLDGFRLLSFGLERLSPYTCIPVSSPKLFAVAEDKAATTIFAEEVGVPAPKTYYPKGLDDLEKYRDIPYPVVVKARRGQGHFGYASSYEELCDVTYPEICSQVPDQLAEGVYPILQEYIKGKGHGFYALMNHGQLRAFFMHERIHEVPPTGGPSAMAKSYYDEELVEVGSKMLRELKWHGVAMVEFKKDEKDGRYKLIEINPKFWGSLGLSIAAGVNFPRLLVEMAANGDVAPVEPPQKPITYQWLSMDMAYSVAVHKPLLWLSYVLKGVPNDFRLNDPLPNLALISQGGMDVVRGKRKVHSTGGDLKA